jgi:hypothetical protein
MTAGMLASLNRTTNLKVWKESMEMEKVQSVFYADRTCNTCLPENTYLIGQNRRGYLW